MTLDAAHAELARALRQIADEIQNRARRHPQADLLRRPNTSLDLEIQIPLSQGEGWLERSSERLSEMIDTGLRDQLNHRSLVRPGSLYCLHCQGTDCRHSQPKSTRDVFVGYRPNGIPKFLDFGQSLLEKRDPRVDRLYSTHPDLLTDLTEGSVLTSEVLPTYRGPKNRYRLHGQVAAGWFAFPTRCSPYGEVACWSGFVSSMGWGSAGSDEKKAWCRRCLPAG